MGPIQTAFSDFFTEVLDQEREKIKQELSKTKEKLVELEEKKKEKVIHTNTHLLVRYLLQYISCFQKQGLKIFIKEKLPHFYLLCKQLIIRKNFAVLWLCVGGQTKDLDLILLLLNQS